MDHFDRIHDSILQLIFNRIEDFKTLCICCAVSKRFNELATQVNTVVLKVDGRMMKSALGYNHSPLINLIRFINMRIVLPIRQLRRWFFDNESRFRVLESSGGGLCIPVVKKFKEIRVFKIVFPSGYLCRVDDDVVLLKWKAEFGPGFRKYVALSAWSAVESVCSNGISHPNFLERQLFMLRIFSVVEQFDAFAREYLLAIISEHSKLDSFVMTDEDGGGELSMTNLRELAMSDSPLMINSSGQVANEVCLSNGVVLKGVGLSVFWNSEQSDNCDLDNMFEEPYDSCLRMLIPMGA